MSDTPSPADPSVETQPKAATATAEKPAEAPAAPKPFNTDLLQSCTSRFTRRAWDLYLEYRKEKALTKMQEQPIAAKLTAQSKEGILKIREHLETQEKVSGITGVKGNDAAIELTATFAQIQSIIKWPETKELDARRLD